MGWQLNIYTYIFKFITFFSIFHAMVLSPSSQLYLLHTNPYHKNHNIPSRDGNRVQQGRRMGSSTLPRMVLFHSIPIPSHITEKILLPYPRPLGPLKAPPHPIKLYFLLICSKTNDN